MVTSEFVAKRPGVSVIVPARNEEVCLGRCLQSLVAQQGVAFEIIVVDDESTDRTRKIALSFPGVHVMDSGPMPPGWTGKNNAVWTGAKRARGTWLLFTDADTVHLPGSLVRSLAEAQQQGAALLSYSPEQEVCGFWEKAVMPVIFADLARTYRPSQVSDSASPVAAANGQYLLISREAYDAVGGHAAVGTSLLEDVALARRVKASGRKIFFRYGADVARTRMYRSFGQLQEGWTKNLALLFPSPVRLALFRLSEFALITGSGIAAVASLGGRGWFAFSAGMVAVVLGAFLLERIHTAHFAWDANILSLIGLPLFSYLLWRSQRFHKVGKVTWKGRYAQTAPTALESPAKPSSRNVSAPEERMVYLTRKAEFSASHYYHNPEFSAEENQRIFGKCNNPNGHGHNYTLEVTVKGEVNPRSGFVVDLKQLKEVLHREVLDAMDHRFLNKEVPEFFTRIPTTENLAIAIWQRLAPKLNAAQLHRVRVYETPDLFVDFYGEA